MTTQLKLLGAPSVYHEGDWLEPPPGKVSALLFYLAYRDVWVSRQELAYLFWPDMPEPNARSNLRKLLARAKGLAYTQGLEAERSRLRWQVDTDLQAFRDAANEGRHLTATQHYHGELLQGFHLDEALEFESWLRGEREALHRLWRKTVLAYAEQLEDEERTAEAAEVLTPLHKADPFDETVLRGQLRLFHLSGQAQQALAVFETFKEVLEREMGVEPEAGTLELVRQLEADKPPPVQVALQSAPPARAKPLPTPGHTFRRTRKGTGRSQQGAYMTPTVVCLVSSAQAVWVRRASRSRLPKPS